MRIISTIKFKKYIIGAYILGIVISKLNYQKKACLVISFKVDQGSKISFYYIIVSLDLTMYLRIEGNEKFLFDTKKIA